MKETGWTEVLRTVKTLLKLPAKLLVFIVFIPVVLVIRLLRPLVIVRTGFLRSDRIGHFVTNTEMYLCERDSGKYDSRTFDLFFCVSPNICNHYLKKMWSRHLHIFSPAIVLRLLDWVNRKIPGAEIHSVNLPNDLDRHDYLTRFKPRITFTDEEEYIGRQYLKSVGISDEDKFICFFARDPAYLKIIEPEIDCSYHNYRDCKIHDLVPGVEEMTRRGYFAIRMGSVVEEKLKTDNPRIIDYATNGDRTEFLDIYLIAKCYFFLQAGGSGIAALARLFRRPVVALDVIPLEYCHGNIVTLIIPKKLWSKEKKRFLTFKEILSSGYGRILFSEEYKKLGIEIVDNTPEEITNAAVEVEERLRGIWRTTEEDEVLQKKFQSIFPENSNLYGKRRSRIGSNFLRQNKNLLD